MGGLRARKYPGLRPAIVAVKRPTFKFGWRSDEDGPLEQKIGFGTPTQLDALELEIVTLCNKSIRNHRNIVKLLAWGVEDSLPGYEQVEPLSPFLVLEHGNCSMREFLSKDRASRIPWQVLRALALDVSQGLSVLHTSKVIHGDLKPDNVLVFPDDNGPFFCIAKLSDFGLSVVDEKDRKFDPGTPGWQAPELPSDEGITADMLVKCDYFSLGLVIFSTIFNFGAKVEVGSQRFTFESARSVLSRSRIPKPAIERISLALESLLQPSPSNRPSDLSNLCSLLEYRADESVFDKKGAWYVYISGHARSRRSG
ncbi:kinase-like domain-containing protein [Morchella snyderi]|nr:kinase-like domain-containing protein [Morchella snyderi]